MLVFVFLKYYQCLSVSSVFSVCSIFENKKARRDCDGLYLFT